MQGQRFLSIFWRHQLKINILVALILFNSCSSVQKSVTTGSFVGGSAGAIGGVIFSPNKESINKNGFLFGVIGAVLGGVLGNLLHDHPKKQNLLNEIILEDKKEEIESIPLFDFSEELKGLNPNISFKPINKYEVPLKKLPKELEGKVKKQYVIEYETQPQTIKIGKKTLEIAPFKAWEHVYEE
jgi:hypothetical protein